MQTNFAAVVVSLVSLGGLVSFGAATQPPAPAQNSEPIGVTTKSGKSANVQVLGVVDGKAELKVFAFGGEVILKRNLDEFVPESQYLIEWRAADPKTFEQHLAMAKRAAELGLLPQAGFQARSAIKVAGSGPDAEAKKKQVHAWAADALEKMINLAVAAGDLDRATEGLELLTTRVPEERTEEQLAKIADSIDALRTRDAAKAATERASKLDAEHAAKITKSLEPIQAKSAVGDKLLSKAISQSANTSASARTCESTVDAYKAAWGMAQDLLKASPQDGELHEAVAPLTDHIAESAIQAAMHAANVLTLQTDYKGAAEWVNRILKFEPDNADAKAMLETIQQAAAASGDRDDYRYGWRRAGRNRGGMR